VCLERDTVQPNSLDLLGLRERTTVVRGDILDDSLTERILNEYEIDAVFHLAAQAIVGAANRSPNSTFETNIRGTYLLLDVCRHSPLVKRIVVASSDKAYGSHKKLPYTEDLSLNAVFPYDVSKACTDLLSVSFAKTYDLPVAISRSANIYGRADLNLSRIIPGTILSVLKDESPVIRSDGTPVREFIHVDDVADAYLLLAENIDRAIGEAFNFGTDAPVQILQLVETIIDLCGKKDSVKPNVLLDRKIDHEIDTQYLSGEKMKEVFGWAPKISLTEGLKDTIEWYKASEALLLPGN
jgi:CDP-glucose 4,6-dehydratase